MGQYGSKHTGPENLESLLKKVAELRALAGDLEIEALRLSRYGNTRRIFVLHHRGVKKALDKVRAFIGDARKKIDELG